MSISTKKGDQGYTSLPGNICVSKADLRIEMYGAVDELISTLGFARSICEDREFTARCKEIQRELFLLTAAIATSAKDPAEMPLEAVERLTEGVHRLEQIEGILSDWSIPGEHPVSAAIDVARAICRRAERNAIRLRESGFALPDTIPQYLNRLSDFLWISGRAIELKSGRDARLRLTPGKRWTRAW